jgi:hypothetical protein
MRTKWTNEEDSILIDNYGTIKPEDMFNIIGRNRNAIYARAQKLGLKSNEGRIYFCNDSFFGKINNSSAYFAGLLAADGNICNNNRFRLELADKELILSLKETIGSNGKIYEKYNGNFKTIYGITITSKQCVLDLDKYWNITTRKSLTLQPPTGLTEEQELAYIIGYIDGDGSIYINNRNQLYFMCCGSHSVIDWMSKKFNRKMRQNGKTDTNFKIEAKCGPALEILKGLYKVYTPIKLSRKWDKVKEMI